MRWFFVSLFFHVMAHFAVYGFLSLYLDSLGYGKGYVYDHGTEEAFSGQNYFPEGMPRGEFYHPTERGFEREVKKRLEYWDKLRRRAAEAAK